jgi:hypothetical protein
VCCREADEANRKVKKTIAREHKHHLLAKAKALKRQEEVRKREHLRVEVRQALTEAVKVAAEGEGTLPLAPLFVRLSTDF